MSLPTRARVVLGIGVVMMAIGAVVALRPLWAGPQPLTNSRWLDVAFAAFFLIRGLMNVRAALRHPPSGTP